VPAFVSTGATLMNESTDVKYAERSRQAQKGRLHHAVQQVLPAGDLPGFGVGVSWSPSFTVG